MVLYGVPKGYIFGLSMDGPGRRTADPVPDDITRWPAFLEEKVDHRWSVEFSWDVRQNVVPFHRSILNTIRCE